ncbi:AAA family ATPase [Clostridium carnis]
MIIKKAKIIAFGGLKDKEINFDNGINLIYGENEKGKSTIQSFIKIWLYGMQGKRTKDIKTNERVRFLPTSGEKIKGELHVKDGEKSYIIRRSFGLTKKEDTCEILDALTGEEVKDISKNEPGKYFLGVNLSTFIKTLFISQLGVLVNKDKEEEMMERAANLLGSGDEKISVQRAIEKLSNIKKSIITSRKTGELDILKEKYTKLLEERYEGYKLSEENIHNEEKNISLKNRSIEIRTELKSLDIYKKYLKKVKLQKEYEEITQYLRKSEELKKKEKFIEESISTNNGIIDEVTINNIKEENNLYMTLIDLREEAKYELEKNQAKYKEVLNEEDNLDFLENIDSSTKEKIFRISIEQQVLKEKIQGFNIINKDIDVLKEDIKNKKNSIGIAYNFKSCRLDIEDLLKNYEDKLKELKFKAENLNDKSNEKETLKEKNKKLNIFKISMGVLLTSMIILIIAFKIKIYILLPLVVISIYLSKRIFDLTIDVKTLEREKGKKEILEKLTDEIAVIEEKLYGYRDLVGAKTYEEFIKKLMLFDEFSNYEERQNLKVKEKEIQLKSIDIYKIKEEYSLNAKYIEDSIKLAKVNTVEELLAAINKYEATSNELLSLKIEVNKGNESLQRLDNEIKIREERIREKLREIGLEKIDLMLLEDKILEIKEKLAQKQELKRALKSIEETYKILTKDKDINLIKEELKDIINENINYSYSSDEEIDSKVKEKSNELIEVEKNIKDVENEIGNRFKGKRSISEIEEEIEYIEEKINKMEIKLKAIEKAINILEEAFRDARNSFGPILNDKVLFYFKKLTKNKYNEVMVSDTYEIKVRGERDIFSGELLSNGANDQLYLSLRLAFISMLYENKEISVTLDDAFIQYDDERVELVLEILKECNFSQLMIYTCQKREMEILKNNDILTNYIYL